MNPSTVISKARVLICFFVGFRSQLQWTQFGQCQLDLQAPPLDVLAILEVNMEEKFTSASLDIIGKAGWANWADKCCFQNVCSEEGRVRMHVEKAHHWWSSRANRALICQSWSVLICKTCWRFSWFDFFVQSHIISPPASSSTCDNVAREKGFDGIWMRQAIFDYDFGSTTSLGLSTLMLAIFFLGQANLRLTTEDTTKLFVGVGDETIFSLAHCLFISIHAFSCSFTCFH